LTNNPPYLGNGARYDVSYYYSPIGVAYGLTIRTNVGELE